ncbi:MAG: LacI family transcriptional regulator, partial [Thermomicrobiales bacterium]|nr:LacI family transcriptional regulator [Thermomicrobiales bacterium]
MSTISEVARRAGVSSATVSRVVSNRGYVSAETRAKVLKAVEELDFVPNAMARGLKTKQSRLIALLVPEIVNSFYTTIARGVEDVANEHGFQVILGNTDESTVKEKTYVDLMVANHIDGIILAPAGRSGRHLKALQAREVPAIVVDRSVEGFKADFVRGDSVNGALQLTQHLLGLNHWQIVFINGHPETSSARDRE